MSVVYHGAPIYIYICNTLPLDNPKIHLHTALPYITVTDFKHLNMTIAKNNLAYPLLKDTFSVLGSSQCEVL